MSLFVRVYTNLFSHRKIVRLRAAIGDDAFWVPIRIWAYAAENQPNGDFSGYTAEEIALLIGYTKDASSMLQALLNVGFLDSNPLRVHDWQEHNSYHQTYAERAKKAAAARWNGQEKKGQEKKGKERKGKEGSIASSMLQACEAIYAEYPRKVGKKKALLAIRSALKGIEVDELLKRTIAYAKSRIGEDPNFTPHPSTWFNQERFNDDPATWVRSKNNGHADKPNPRNFGIVGETVYGTVKPRLQRELEEKKRLASQVDSLAGNPPTGDGGALSGV